jgi:hypothetical protein
MLTTIVKCPSCEEEQPSIRNLWICDYCVEKANDSKRKGIKHIATVICDNCMLFTEGKMVCVKCYEEIEERQVL